MRYRNSFWVLNGVVGSGFGVVLVAVVLRCFPTTVRGRWCMGAILNIFVVFQPPGAILSTSGVPGIESGS